MPGRPARSVLRLDPGDQALPLSCAFHRPARVRRPADQLADYALKCDDAEGRLLGPPPAEVDVLGQEMVAAHRSRRALGGGSALGFESAVEVVILRVGATATACYEPPKRQEVVSDIDHVAAGPAILPDLHLEPDAIINGEHAFCTARSIFIRQALCLGDQLVLGSCSGTSSGGNLSSRLSRHRFVGRTGVIDLQATSDHPQHLSR